MEDRETIREKHGVANARKVSAAEIQNSDIQAVTVTDGKECEVILALKSAYGIAQWVGHDHIAPGRKNDPGPGFSWARIAQLHGVTCPVK